VSELVQTGRPVPASTPPSPTWRVRPAGHGDASAVAVAVRELLLEMGGTPPALAEMETAARALIDSPKDGAALVAQSRDGLVGVLGASWQAAIHVPGRYALIQDLWVHPRWRGRAVGTGLLAALFELARATGLQRVEVGLPRESFDQFAATEAFYLGNGFSPNGPRLRRVLS
jgi:GNAT superfamily N-acetyltransferase